MMAAVASIFSCRVYQLLGVLGGRKQLQRLHVADLHVVAEHVNVDQLVHILLFAAETEKVAKEGRNVGDEIGRVLGSPFPVASA